MNLFILAILLVLLPTLLYIADDIEQFVILLLLINYGSINEWLRVDLTGGGLFVSPIDFLFFTYVLYHVLSSVKGREIRIKYRSDLYFAILTFATVVLLLPLLAVITGGWGFSVLTPGIRHVQWMCFLVLGYRISLQESNVALGLLAVSAAISVLLNFGYSILQYAMFWGIFDSLPHFQYFAGRQSWFYSWRATGFLLNPNHLGMATAVAGGILYSSYDHHQEHTKLLLGGLGAVPIVLLMSGSRTGLLMMALSVVIVSVLRWEPYRDIGRLNRIETLVAGIGVTIVVLYVPKIRGRLSSLIQVFTGNFDAVPHLAQRFVQWNKAIEFYTTTPVYGTLVASTFTTDLVTENFYLNMLIQAGPLGLLAPLLLYLVVVRMGIQLYCSKKDPISWCMVATTFAISIGNITAYAMLLPPIAVYFWTILGVGYGELGERSQPSITRATLPPTTSESQ